MERTGLVSPTRPQEVWSSRVLFPPARLPFFLPLFPLVAISRAFRGPSASRYVYGTGVSPRRGAESLSPTGRHPLLWARTKGAEREPLKNIFGKSHSASSIQLALCAVSPSCGALALVARHCGSPPSLRPYPHPPLTSSDPSTPYHQRGCYVPHLPTSSSTPPTASAAPRSDVGSAIAVTPYRRLPLLALGSTFTHASPDRASMTFFGPIMDAVTDAARAAGISGMASPAVLFGILFMATLAVVTTLVVGRSPPRPHLLLAHLQSGLPTSPVASCSDSSRPPTRSRTSSMNFALPLARRSASHLASTLSLSRATQRTVRALWGDRRSGGDRPRWT